jgi:PPOX class probable F420-dependent enzyme
MRRMGWAEASQFLLAGTRTANLATVQSDGQPHVVPVWFTLDGDELILSTPSTSVKGRNLRRDPRVALSIDDQAPPFAFVSIRGVAELQSRPDDLLAWTTRIAERYLGPDRAADAGASNAQIDDLLVRVRIVSFTAMADVVE